MAVVLISLALPTVLRPPQPPPDSSAELSPDAPPDDTESIVAALQRGTSGTAGAGTGELAAGPEDPAIPVPPPTVPSPPRPRFCPHGFGEPPRQVESLYSAPCAAAWQGDNGGATYKGVTETEFRVGVALASTQYPDAALSDGEGPVISDEPQPNESDAYRTWRVYQNYFNRNFQLWGRHLRFVVAPQTSGSPRDAAQIRAAVQALDEEHNVFAVYTEQAPGLEEVARRQLVGFGGVAGEGEALYRDNQPYLSGWYATGTTMMRFAAEYVCKRLAGQPAAFAGGAEQNKPRKFGVITTEYAGLGGGTGSELAGIVRDQCGGEVVTVVFDPASGFQSFSTGVAKFRSENVTTVIPDIDVVWVNGYLSNADAQGYFPEYFVPGTWTLDSNSAFHRTSFSKTQWSHAFGLSAAKLPQLTADTDGYRAYRSIDPHNEPVGLDFATLLQIVNGIQMAGPDLNPDSVRAGLNRLGTRTNDPPWSIGGGYGPDDYTYADDEAEIWWDVAAVAPNTSEGERGAWRYVDCGRRHRLGQIPAGDPKVFNPNGTCLAAPPGLA